MAKLYDSDAVKEYVCQILFRRGVPEKKADIVSNALVEADMREIFSHGLNILDELIIQSIMQGGTIPDAEPIDITYTQDSPIRHLDANGGLGYPIAMHACEIVKDLAREHGMARVYVTNTNHFGIGAIYSEEIAKDKDLVGEVTCTTPSMVIPYGGNEKRLGTNVFSGSVPYDKGIITIDMATTVHAANPITKAIGDGRPLPFPVFTERGDLTIEAGYFKGSQDFLLRGSVPPLGALGRGQGDKGDAGYKGSGLAIFIELLGVLAGGFSTKISPIIHTGDRRIRQTFEACRIDTLSGDNSIALEEISKTVRDLRKSGDKNMLLPGEKEHRARQRALERGIEYQNKDIERLENCANEVRIDERLQPIAA
jgi:LDH2 family malate/lactate/ureidoglycolate dehydrogenase